MLLKNLDALHYTRCFAIWQLVPIALRRLLHPPPLPSLSFHLLRLVILPLLLNVRMRCSVVVVVVVVTMARRLQ